MPNTDQSPTDDARRDIAVVDRLELLSRYYGERGVGDEERVGLCAFAGRLRVANERVNLSGVKTEEGIFDAHVLDALAPLLWEDCCGLRNRILDLGSGAGTPGGPLSLTLKERVSVVSLERNRKKFAFQAAWQADKGPENFLPVCANLDEWKPEAPFDGFIARAVDALEPLLKAARRVLKVGGRAVLWKGRRWEAEWEVCSSRVAKGFTFRGARRYDFKEIDKGGYLLLFDKR